MRTIGAFINGRACSDTLLHVLNRAFDEPVELEEKAVMPLAGGILQHGYQCGMLWGTALAAGAQAYRLYGGGAEAEIRAMTAARRAVNAFRAKKDTINCIDITNIDKSSSTIEMMTYFFLKGGTISCFRMAAQYAHVAYAEINAAFAGSSVEMPSAPVSCTAMLARKMGLSPRHRVMMAAFAGGIGLSGGACGALGAAIWVLGMNRIKKGDKIDYKSAEGQEVIDRFVKLTDCEFECAEIVGRIFESIADHADYLCNGGCAKIIEGLAEIRNSQDGEEE
jgi:hypothetical protein